MAGQWPPAGMLQGLVNAAPEASLNAELCFLAEIYPNASIVSRLNRVAAGDAVAAYFTSSGVCP